MGMSQADNSVKIWRNLPISNPKQELLNVNAYSKFGENPLLFTQSYSTAQVVFQNPPPPKSVGLIFQPTADLPDTPLQFPQRQIFRPPRFRRVPSAKPPTYL